MFYPERHSLNAEKRVSQFYTGGKRLLAALNSGVHHANQAWPIHWRSAFELSRSRIAQPRKILSIESLTQIIQTAPTGPAKHLKQFIGFDLPFEVAGEITTLGHNDRAHGKVDAGGKSHCRNNRIELTGFGERFDHTC